MGAFADINNDIANVNYFEYPRNIAMSYAYVRVAAASGLFLQGIFDDEALRRANMMFHAMQQQTYVKDRKDPKNVFFQEKCFSECEQFMMSYDKRLTKKILQIFCMAAKDADNISQIKIDNYEILLHCIYKIGEKLKIL